jgi:amino acid adenylation domain-containing protein
VIFMLDINTSNRKSQLTLVKRALLEKRLQAALKPQVEHQTISRRPGTSRLPLSYGQERLWFLHQLDPDNPNHNRPMTLHIAGDLNVEALKHSIGEILRRHSVLRAVFENVDGRPQQVLIPLRQFEIPVIDLSMLPATDRRKRAQVLAAREANEPFNLESGPLVRARLFSLEANEYVLIVVMHHILFDGWSAAIFKNEFCAFYSAFSRGKSSPLSPLSIQYADFASWQRQRLQGNVTETLLSYWKNKLSSLPPPLKLPTDHPGPAKQPFKGAHRYRTLPRDLVSLLKKLSYKEDVTLFMILLTAFKVLLYRYTNQNDIVIGCPVAGRMAKETETLIGLFVNTVVLRTDLSGNPPFRDLLSKTKQTVLEALAHQELPFEKLVMELQPARDLSQSPFFQVLFNFENVATQPMDIEGLEIEEVEFDSGAEAFSINLEIVENSAGLYCQLGFNADLFEPDMAESLLEHYEALLSGIVENPNRVLSDIPMLTESEYHQILVTWNSTDTNYPEDRCLHDLFEEQVAKTPQNVAVEFECQRLTYNELNCKANQLAHHFQKLGVGPETLVGIYLERSLEMVLGFLGVLKAGGAYIPLDPDYPEERLAFILDDARITILLTQTQLVDKLPPHRANVICLDGNRTEFDRESKEDLVSAATADNPAYIIYTSGSTGKPKGVIISHGAICNQMLWMQHEFPLNPADRVVQTTPFSFDASSCEFYAPLLVGAELIMTRPGGHQDSTYLVKLIAEKNISVLNLVPSMLKVLLEEEGLRACNSLQRVFCGGEALSVELQERFFSILPAKLYNMYGPTEATIDATFWHCRHEEKQLIVPIGRPVANTQIYILDHHLQPVPVGVPGELYIGGKGLARGYLNRPELTTEKFNPNPFSNSPGSLLYKSGDLARYRRDGAIEYLGRIDHQVKIRGFRIELGEIEMALNRHSSVQLAVAVVCEDMPGDKRLVAYVVLNPTHVADVSALRSFLSTKLPDYMLPAAYVILDAMPLLPNGKIDRRALPTPDKSRPDLQAAFVSPRNDIEKEVVGIWERVLRLNQVGVHDNFFDLGGHSLLATRIISKLRDVFKIDFPLRLLFDSPTAAALAVKICQFQNENNDRKDLTLLVDDLEEISDEEAQRLLSENENGENYSN